VKYERTTSFLRDISKIPPEHFAMFQEAVRKWLLPALDDGAHTGRVPWPPRLRVHRLSGSAVYSLTWNFAFPDGRATFEFGHTETGEPVLIWRRIGDHSIYDRP